MGRRIMKCKFPKEKCSDRYYHHETIAMCRLPERKKKRGTCPYDKNIKVGKTIRPKRLAKGQTKLI